VFEDSVESYHRSVAKTKFQGAARLYNLVLALVTAETQSSNTELSNMASGKRSRFFIG
jgi:hypothetical protein